MVRRNACSRGFTLLELLVVLTLAGLIVALVPPLFSKVMPGLRLRTQVEEVATVLREARVRALRVGVVTEVAFSSDDSRYRGADGASHRLEKGVRLSVAGPSGFERAGPGASDFAVRFFPDGSSSGGRIELAGEGGRYRVDVDWLIGRIGVERQDG